MARDIASRARRTLASHRKRFSIRAATVLLGSLAGQAVAFLVLPLTTRVYDAEVLGQAAAVLAAVSIASIILFLQYDQAVIVAADEDVPHLLLLCCMIAVSLVAVISGLIVSDQFGLFFRGRAVLAEWNINWTFPLLVLTYGSLVLFVNLRLRGNELEKVSGGRLIYYGGGALLQVAAGAAFGGRVHVYLLAQVVASVIAALYLAPFQSLHGWILHRKEEGNILAKTRAVAKRYRKFPMYQTGAGLINAISIYAPTIFLKLVFGDAWAGWYFIAWRIVTAPATLLAQAVGQVFYRDSAERERSGTRQDWALEQTASGLLHVSLIPAIAVGLAAPLAVSIFFDEEWYPVAIFIQLLLVGASVGLFTAPLSTFLNVKGLQFQDLLYKSLLMVLRMIALVIGSIVGSAFFSILAYSVVTSTVMIFYFDFILRSGGASAQRVFRRAAPLLVDSVLIIIIAAILALAGMLYQPVGLAIISLAIAVAALRDIKRWGKGVQERAQSLEP